jgi:hypothetical protein
MCARPYKTQHLSIAENGVRGKFRDARRKYKGPGNHSGAFACLDTRFAGRCLRRFNTTPVRTRSGDVTHLSLLPQRLPDLGQMAVFSCIELDVLIMAEKRIDIVGSGQDVAAPAVHHGQLEERCEIFRFVFEK